MRLTNTFTIVTATVLVIVSLAAPARAEQQVQHWLAAQHDWGASKGFFLTVQNVANPGAPATLKRCRLQLGIGDGKQWRFVEASTDWSLGAKYAVRAVVAEGSATLWLDGREVGKTQVDFAPADCKFSGGYQPSFLMGPADYWVVQSDVSVVSDLDRIERKFVPAQDTAAVESLRLLNPTIGAFMAAFKTGTRVEVEANFLFAPAPAAPQGNKVLLDEYGQATAATFPGKVTADQQLRDNIAVEQQWLKSHPKPGGFDQFGGVKESPWKGKATGYYRTEKRGEFWWLISPEGNPCFYVGVCDVPSPEWEATPVTGRESMFERLPPREGVFAGAWKKNIWGHESPDVEYFIHHAANLIRKYGDSWKDECNASAVARVGALGFSGFGKWAQPLPGVPIVPVLYPKGVDMLTAHPDPWNPVVQRQVREWLEREIGSRRNDPFVVGWSISNERDAFPSADDVKKALAASESPARKAMLAHAHEKQLDPASEQGIEQMRLLYANALFELYYRTVKEVDPNHLYMGNWVTPNWWINENDWHAVAKHCDVLGFDRYAPNLKDEPLDRLMAAYDKPMLCGEFSFPPDYNGERGYGTYPVSVRTEQEAGELYTKWMADSAAHPKLIGVLYFQYRDQPLLGRGPGAGAANPVIGENFAFGLIDVTDRLKTGFCETVRTANLQATPKRFVASERGR